MEKLVARLILVLLECTPGDSLPAPFTFTLHMHPSCAPRPAYHETTFRTLSLLCLERRAPLVSTDTSNNFSYTSVFCSGTYLTYKVAESKIATALVLVVGLAAFAAMFAVNSSVHSYLIVSYSNKVRLPQEMERCCLHDATRRDAALPWTESLWYSCSGY